MAVAFRWGIASMQMRRDWNRQLVYLTHESFASTSCLDGWSREDPIVAPDGGSKARQDMCYSWLLRDLVVVGFFITANRRKHRRNGKWNGKGLYGGAGH